MWEQWDFTNILIFKHAMDVPPKSIEFSLLIKKRWSGYDHDQWPS